MPVKKPEDKPAITRRVARAIEYLTQPQEDGTVLKKTAVAQLIAERFRVNIRTAWGDVKEAEKKVSEAMAADLPGLKTFLVAELVDVIAETKERKDSRTRVRAVDTLARITGANAPAQVELSAKAGVMVVAGVAQTPEQWEALHAPTPGAPAVPPVAKPTNGHTNGTKS